MLPEAAFGKPTMDDKRATVLVIDDSPTSAHQLFALLGDDYDMLVATRGEAGIELAAGENPDLILLDVVMPELGGYEVCRRLKADERTAHIPVVFVTSYGEESEEAHGLSLGAIDYLTKPLAPAIVRARVRNHVELKRSRDQLLRLTTLDPLTGIDNRRRFDESLAKEWGRAMRDAQPLSLVMIDVDRFKDINDRHGHAVGDHCLVRVAAALRGALQRAADVLTRYGGEEFACLLPATDLSGAMQTAERMRAAVEALVFALLPADAEIPDDQRLLRVTVSIGVASVVPRDGMPPRSLLEASDGALYEAKLAGRNCVCAQRAPH